MSSIVKVDTIQENTSANGITVDGLNIKDSKLVTANSVVTSNITADAIDATKIADDAISEEHLDVTSITGHSAETSVADDDLILISDTSASAALKKMTRANFVSGIGGTNTPLFRATVSGTQAVPNATNTKIDFNTEVYDPQSTYDTSNKRFTPGVGGYYFIGAKIRSAIDNDFGYFTVKIYKNGTPISTENNSHFHHDSVSVSVIDLADTNDYYEVFSYHNKGTGENYSSDTNEMQFFGNKLIT